MNGSFRLRAALATVILVGCAPQVEVGAPCALRSDCPDPLTCLLGRCRSECTLNLDCPEGAMCLLDEASGERACRTQRELTCADPGGEPCDAALACIAGFCTQRCRDTSDCAGTVCNEVDAMRVCVEPTGRACSEAMDCAFGLCAPTGRCNPVLSIAAGGFDTCMLLESGRIACAGSNGSQLLVGSYPPEFVSAFVPVVDGAGGQPPFESIELGSRHICALSGGRVRCWGAGELGQNGAGVSTGPIPSPFSMPVGVREISVAVNTTCMRTADDVFCFGWDQFGQLGDAAIHGTGSLYSTSPVRVALELPVGVSPVRLEVGGYHACVIDSEGALHCWGGNDYAQISSSPSSTCMYAGRSYGCEPTPVRVPGFGPSGIHAVDLALGQSHTCVLDDMGAVHCFGRNNVGQLGAGALAEMVSSPVRPLTSGVRAIDAGLYFTCARFADGRLSCWGANAAGQLGTGVGELSVTPTDVDGLTNIVDFACGEEHACALNGNGAVFCWGSANDGRLGDDPAGGALRPPVVTPVRVFASTAM